jgi:hypothetical protein
VSKIYRVVSVNGETLPPGGLCVRLVSGGPIRGVTRGRQLQVHCTHKQRWLLSRVGLRVRLCPPYLRSLVEDTVQAFNDSWLLPLAEREVFESGMARLARLQGFAPSSGFAVVTTASRAGRFRFGCIHHGNESEAVRFCQEMKS